MSASVEFREVSFITRDGRTILDHVSLSVDEGSVIAILGRSGSGKTTLLRTVNRLIPASSGDVLVQGRRAAGADLIALRRGIGYVIQETGLFPHFSIERNVGIVLEAERRPREERTARCADLLDAVGLDPASFRNRYPHQLSGGQRQRVGLARALAADPPILLMDEPFGALDPLTRGEMQDMLRGLLGRMRKTVLLVTHDLDEALYLADRIALLGGGRLIALLTPDEFVRSDNAEVQSYVRAFHRGERQQGLAGPGANA